jgi:V/A-type H+-transporting ATPase subunit D
VTAQRLTVPPGRAGRLRLVRRLETARRGAGLLDRKLAILRDELTRRRSAAARTAANWEACQAEAERWLLRACLLGGQRAIRLGAGGPPAEVTVARAATMGISYPARAACTVPPAASWDGPAVAQARKAHRAALAAAVQHAAAAEAARILGEETALTGYRLRAVRDRWIPRLEQALEQVSFAIEEQERADAARLRRAVDQDAGRTRPVA